MEQLKDDMLSILDRKISEEAKMVATGLEGELGHVILEEEIKDAGSVIKAIEDENLDCIRGVASTTTSPSIYNAIKKFEEEEL